MNLDSRKGQNIWYIWMFPKMVVPPNHPFLEGFPLLTIHFEVPYMYVLRNIFSSRLHHTHTGQSFSIEDQTNLSCWSIIPALNASFRVLVFCIYTSQVVVWGFFHQQYDDTEFFIQSILWPYLLPAFLFRYLHNQWTNASTPMLLQSNVQKPT